MKHDVKASAHEIRVTVSWWMSKY